MRRPALVLGLALLAVAVGRASAEWELKCAGARGFGDSDAAPWAQQRLDGCSGLLSGSGPRGCNELALI
jgi:hypothetical protein